MSTVQLYDASVDPVIKTITISTFIEDLGNSEQRMERLLEFSGNADGGSASILLSNNGVDFTEHALISGVAGNATFNLLGSYIRIDGTLLGALADIKVTLS